MQEVAPFDELYVPIGQAVQDEAPFDGLNVPIGQIVQEADPLKEKKPGEH